MNTRNKNFKLEFAGQKDAEELLKIYEESDFQGDISVLYARRPDPFSSLSLEGEKTFIPIMRDLENNKLFAMGGCIIRSVYLNGEIRKAGYLTGLKVLPEYRNNISFVPGVYKELFEKTKDEVDVYYTTIISENEKGRRFLEKKHRDMPFYRYIGEYTTYFLKTGVKAKQSEYTIKRGLSSDLKSFYEAEAKKLDFSPVDLNLPHLSENDFFAVCNGQDEIVGMFALWNQQSYKQYIVTAYSGIYKYLYKLPTGILGYPDFPKTYENANYVTIALVISKEDNPELKEHIIARAVEMSKGYAFAMIGVTESHPFKSSLDKRKSIKYKSRLYSVEWENRTYDCKGKAMNIEVGLL